MMKGQKYFTTQLIVSLILLFFLQTASAAQINISSTNLHTYIDFSNLSSYSGTGSTATDLSGNSNHYSINGTYTFSSNYGGYLNFDGSTYLLDTPTSLPSYNSSSFLWIYPNSLSTVQNLINFNRTVSGIADEIILQIDASGNLSYWEWNGAVFTVTSSSCALTSNKWYYVGFVRTDNTSSLTTNLFVNGINCASGTNSTRIDMNGGNKYVVIGRDYRDNNNGFSGYIGGTSIYSYSLDTPTIQSNMANSILKMVSLSSSNPKKLSTTNNLVATYTAYQDGLISFYYNNRKINGCQSLLGSSGSATCKWKSILHGQQYVGITFKPVGTLVNTSMSSLFPVTIGKRTNSR